MIYFILSWVGVIFICVFFYGKTRRAMKLFAKNNNISYVYEKFYDGTPILRYKKWYKKMDNNTHSYVYFSHDGFDGWAFIRQEPKKPAIIYPDIKSYGADIRECFIDDDELKSLLRGAKK